MNSDLKLKTYKCTIHPSEAIKRVDKNPSAEKIFYCIDCIMDAQGDLRSKLVLIDDLVQNLYAHQASSTGGRKIGTKVPDNLAAILNTEEEAVSKFEEYILKQRNLVSEKFNVIEQEILGSLQAIKSKILDSLEDQLNLFRSNYSTYKKELDKYYGEDIQSTKGENELTKETFFEELNSFNSTRDLENMFKTLLREANLDEMKDISTEGIVAKLTTFKEALEQNTKLQPKSIILIEDELKSSLALVQKALQGFGEGISLIQNSVYPITGAPLDSAILKPTDLEFLADKIQNGKPLSLKHKISIKSDGSNLDKIMQAALDSEQKTLSVIKGRKGT